MPRKNTLDTFGPEFEQLLLRADHALRNGSPEFAVQFSSPNLAAKLRFRAYAYFRALKSSPDRPDLTAMCTDLSIRTASSALVFFRTQDSADARALRTALGLPEGFADTQRITGVIAPSSGHSANLEKLNEIRNRK